MAYRISEHWACDACGVTAITETEEPGRRDVKWPEGWMDEDAQQSNVAAKDFCSNTCRLRWVDTRARANAAAEAAREEVMAELRAKWTASTATAQVQSGRW